LKLEGEEFVNYCRYTPRFPMCLRSRFLLE